MIHPPSEAPLIPGKAEVFVVQSSDSAKESQASGDFPEGVPEIARDLARFAHRQESSPLPPDFALNHDHYLHGAPKGIDQS
jgi:hypothetical protein